MTHGPTSGETPPLARICASAGVLACNEEQSIGPMLESVMHQNYLQKLADRGQVLELLVVTNGCTDRTAEVARQFLEQQSLHHPYHRALEWRVIELAQRGKLNAWNEFVHRQSAKEAEFLFLLDGDILLQHPQTLWNMQQALETNTRACVATDQPIKDIANRHRKSWQDRVSLATTGMNQTGHAQITGQLYCIRTPVARNIYLPRDLAACEDGFIKSLVCTFFLTRESSSERVTRARNASHVFEAYRGLPDIFRNQKRQIMGQTVVHILVDDYLRKLPLEQKLNFADTIREKEAQDPDWLKGLIAAHLRRVRHFWCLFPGLLTFRFQRLARLKGMRKVIQFPVAAAGFAVTMAAAWQAWRLLSRGSTNYWPDTQSPNLKNLNPPTSEPSTAIAGAAQ